MRQSNRWVYFLMTTLAWTLPWLGAGGCGSMEAEQSAVPGDGGTDSLLDKVGASVRYEAEDRSAEQGCSERSNHAGFTGAGFMDFGGQGTWVEWNDIRVATAGEYELTFRYANGSRGNRHSAIILNGDSAGSLDFGPTGSWPSWNTTTLTATLPEGVHTLRVQADTGAGGPNLDHLMITALDLCPDDPDKVEPGDCGCGTPEGSCGGSSYCALADEGRSLELSCDGDATITAIDFASYGTPTGSCDTDFERSGCHADTSLRTVESACLGKQTCEVSATNGVFGDPCRGTYKRLGVVYTCSSIQGGSGLIRRHYSGEWSRLPSFDTLQADAEDVADTVSVGPYGGTERYGLVFEGDIRIDAGGPYEFELGSDDGSRLIIDGQLVVDNDGLHGFQTRTGDVDLSAGLHSLRVEFFERTGGDRVRLRYRAAGDSFVEVPASILSHGSLDACPDDPLKTDPGACGCGVPEGECGPGGDQTVKVFILAGQSNMVGHGTVSPNDAQRAKNGGEGTLEHLVTASPQAAEFAHLVDEDGSWAERDDVWIVDQTRAGPLSVGYGTNADHIGPELMFGNVMGDFYDNPVVIIKVAWGGKSLAQDFRPPSAGGQVGQYYTRLVDRVHEVLDNLEQHMPGYAGQGYEIAGFGWHQGWNDRINQASNDEYQSNCVHLINDLREELGAPNMPFVLATTGMSGWDETHPRALSLMEAQLAVPGDGGLRAGNVAAVETRDYWRDADDSPADQGYHWNRNAESYALIGKGMGDAMVSLMPADELASIQEVYFGQNHVLTADNPLFKLVSNREALIKVQVTAPEAVRAPQVTAVLSLAGQSTVLQLEGPEILPTDFVGEPGRVQHGYEDSFTAFIPREWVQPGLSIVVNAGNDRRVLEDLEVGAPNKVIMTMFDVHYFQHSPGDYPAGWQKELEAKWPVSELELRRLNDIVFEELIVPPRAGVRAARVSSKDDYKAQTGLNFDGEQAAALQWSGALKAAAGTGGRISLYYVNIYGVGAGGQAGGFGGVGNGRSIGILNHELGHALSLPHWGPVAAYPYRGEMYGIPAQKEGDEPHAGPTWAFDLPTGTFIPPTVQPGAARGNPGEYKADPMWGGGWGDQEEGFLMRHFSDYSVNQMRDYLENHIVVYNPQLGEYASWDAQAGDYTRVSSNNGVKYPVRRDEEVITVMAGVSVADAIAHPELPNLVYPPIGPYVTGLIDLFDPNVAEDRARADEVYCPREGCDFSLRIVQGGQVKTYMLPIAQAPGVDPLSRGSLQTRALNLPASGGQVTRVELLCTPDAEKDNRSSQQPACPANLDSWSR